MKISLLRLLLTYMSLWKKWEQNDKDKETYDFASQKLVKRALYLNLAEKGLASPIEISSSDGSFFIAH